MFRARRSGSTVSRWLVLAVVLAGQLVPATLTLSPVGRSAANGLGPASSAPTANIAAVPATPSASYLATSMDWVPWTPTAPIGTAGAGIAANATTGESILFGGVTAAGLSGASYLYWESNNSWAPTSPAGAPSPRAYFGLASDPAQDTAVLFGGETNLSTLAVTNDTWTYDFGLGTWTNISGVVAPAPRQDPAFSVGDGIALLFGGWAQNVSGIGEQTYSDTWILNLTTDVWSRVSVSGPSPGALHGSSLAWDPALGEFLLVGGCYPCSSALWTFSPTNLTWSPLAAGGSAPPGGMNSVWAYDPDTNLFVLYGGTNGSGGLGGTYLYQTTTHDWTKSAAASPPAARWGAAADFLDLPDNATLFLTGGTDGAGPFSDTWRFSAVVNVTVLVKSSETDAGVANATVTVGTQVLFLTNSSGYTAAVGLPATATGIQVNQIGFLEFREIVWFPPGADLQLVVTLVALAPGALEVQVATPTGTPVAGAAVALTNATQVPPGSPAETGPSGLVEFSGLPSANYSVTVNKTGYHGFTGEVWAKPGVVTNDSIQLLPLFVLTVNTYATLPNGTSTPLASVAISTGGTSLLGRTNASGVLVTTLSVAGLLTVRAEEYGFYNKSASFNASITGAGMLNMTLLPRPYPVITIEILGQLGHGVGFPVFNATVAVRNLSAIPTGAYANNFTTNVDGAVSFSPPTGNYSIRVSGAGFLTNDSIPTLIAPFGANLSRTYYLSLIGFSSISVLVLSRAKGNPPIDDAHLALSFSGTNLSDGRPYPPKFGSSLATGWANFSGIPQGTTSWAANATGFEPANGSFSVVFGSPHNVFTIYLTPIPPPKYTGLSIFPAAPDAFWTLILLPAAGIVGALVYLTLLRTPSSRAREVHDAAQVDRRRRRRDAN